MATRRTQAPLIHASAGPAAQLVSAQTHTVNASAPGGVGRRRPVGGGGGGEVIHVGGKKVKPDPNAPAAQRGNDFQVFRNGRGDWEVRAGDGKTVLKRGRAGEWDAIIKRGGAGGTLNAHDLAVYREATGWRSDEERAAEAAALQRQQKMANDVQEEQWRRERDEIAHKNNMERDAAKGRRTAEIREAERNARAEVAEKNRQTQRDIAQGRIDAAAQKRAEAQALKDAAAEQWNERYGVTEGTRLSDSEKKLIESGRKIWTQDRKELDAIEEERKRILEGNSLDDTVKRFRTGDDGKDILGEDGRRRVFTDREFGLYKLDKRREALPYALRDNPDAPTAEQIVAGARQNGGYYTDSDGNLKHISEFDAVSPEQKAADALERERRAYILGEVGKAQKAFDARDPMTQGYNPAAVFDPKAAIKAAQANWDAVTGKPANPDAAAPSAEENEDDDPYSRWK